MRRAVEIAILGLVIVAAVYGCSLLIYSEYHVRFRLTVEVQDGDRIRTGSSIVEVEYPIGPDSIPALGRSDSFRHVTGYVVTIDLGEKGLLFLTFQDAETTAQQTIELSKRIFCQLEQMPCLPFVAYAKPGSLPVTMIPSEQAAALRALLRQSGPHDIPFAALPQLVMFTDINDKRTQKIVSPFDLAASFGPGVELRRVVLELTRDAITPAPQKWPPWLKIKRQNTEFRGSE